MDHRKVKLPIYKWNRVTDVPPLQPRPRHGHRAVCIKDLMVVFGGGNEGIHDGLHVFNTDTERWYVPLMKGDPCPGRAAFGFVVDNTRIIAFGGMLEYSVYCNDLYELQASRWEWKRLTPQNTHQQAIPCPRIGHSFNLLGSKVYLFGGLTVSKTANGNDPRYLNDLFVLELRSDGSVAWDSPRIYGPVPPARESHSAVTYQDPFGREKLIVYGGMNGNRLGDLWTLHLGTMQWTKELVRGKPPLPRSLHSATVMSNRMFVFGGWVPLIYDKDTDNHFSPNAGAWKCCNKLACLNLDTMYWEELTVEAPEKNLPRARAGHSAVAINSRVYIWAGRDAYNTAWNNQVCCKDMWYLEVEKPGAVGRIQLISSSVDGLTMGWSPMSCVDHYILQIQRTDIPLFKTHPLEESPKHYFSSLSTKQALSPPQISFPQQISQNILPYPTNESVTNVPLIGASSSSSDVKPPTSVPPPPQSVPHAAKVANVQNQSPYLVTSAVSPVTNVSSPVLAKTSHLPQNLSQQLAVTTTAPIIITIPTSLSEQILAKSRSNPVIVPSSFKTVTTVANGNKPAYTITSMSKPTSSHVRVPTMPLHSRTKGSDVRYPSHTAVTPKLIGNHHSSVRSLPYLQSPTSRSEHDNIPARTNTISYLEAKMSRSSETTVSDKSRVSHYNQVAKVQQLVPVVSNTPPVQAIKAITSHGPNTIISKSLGKPIRWNLQKIIGSSQSKCVIVPNPSSQTNTPKENILKLNQMNQQKTTIKVVHSQGQVKQILKLGETGKPSTIVLGKPPSSTATSSLKPGTKFITIKGPLAFKTSSGTRMNSTNIVHLQPATFRQVNRTTVVKSPPASTISEVAIIKSTTGDSNLMELNSDASNIPSKPDLKRSAVDESNESSTEEKIMKLS